MTVQLTTAMAYAKIFRDMGMVELVDSVDLGDVTSGKVLLQLDI